MTQVPSLGQVPWYANVTAVMLGVAGLTSAATRLYKALTPPCLAAVRTARTLSLKQARAKGKTPRNWPIAAYKGRHICLLFPSANLNAPIIVALAASRMYDKTRRGSTTSHVARE